MPLISNHSAASSGVWAVASSSCHNSMLTTTMRLLARHRPRRPSDMIGAMSPAHIMAPIPTCSVSSTSSPIPKAGLAPSYGDQQGSQTNLAARMAELGICSVEKARSVIERCRNTNQYQYRPQRELKKIRKRLGDDEIQSLHDLREVIYVRGKPVLDDMSVSSDETDISMHPGMPIRLSKRCSELGMCSRREAADILKRVNECSNTELRHLKEVIYLRGKPVTDGAAVKVPPDEVYIQIKPGDDNTQNGNGQLEKASSYVDQPWDKIQGDTIVLHKPIGYVSGNEEHQHVPAVRLLTRDNMHLNGLGEKERQSFLAKDSPVLNFVKWKFSGFDKMANSVPRHIRDTLSKDKLNERQAKGGIAETLSGYAPAGRLDIDSTGVIIFTRAGVMARRLIEPKSRIPKEYIVKVEPAVQVTKQESEMGLMKLPPPTKDLSVLFRKGNKLFGEFKPLRPLVKAEWLNDDADEGDNHGQKSLTMRLVLIEGKKRQIRRMCRELLGWHVVDLCRTSIGPVQIDSLPVGKWRPLTKKEVRGIFESQPSTSTKSSPKSSRRDHDRRRLSKQRRW